MIAFDLKTYLFSLSSLTFVLLLVFFSSHRNHKLSLWKRIFHRGTRQRYTASHFEKRTQIGASTYTRWKTGSKIRYEDTVCTILVDYKENCLNSLSWTQKFIFFRWMKILTARSPQEGQVIWLQGELSNDKDFRVWHEFLFHLVPHFPMWRQEKLLLWARWLFIQRYLRLSCDIRTLWRERWRQFWVKRKEWLGRHRIQRWRQNGK